MDQSQLRWLRISSKGYKKQVLFSPSELLVFKNSIRNLGLEDFMLINTNIGLDIYYVNPTNANDDVLTLFASINPSAVRIHSAYKTEEFLNHMHTSFVKLSAMPLLFKSYTASLLAQLDSQFEEKNSIILPLFNLWHQTLFTLSKTSKNHIQLKIFLSNLQQLYVQNKYHPLLKRLIKEATDISHKN